MNRQSSRDAHRGVLDAFDPGTGEPLDEADYREMWSGARALMRARRSGSSLVTIQEGGGLPPLFLTALGDWSVLALQRFLPTAPAEQPLYALRRVFPQQHGGTRASIEEMAARQVEAVRCHQETGPYFLGGYCAAGVVAFEMARQMRAAGERVELLFLIDTPNPQHGLRRLGGRRFATHLQRHVGWRARAGYLFTTLRRVARLESRRLLRGVYQGLGRQLPDQLENRGPRESMRECRDYRPPPYAGSLVLVRSSDHRPGPGVRGDLGWGLVARGGVEVHPVAGSHRDLLCGEAAAQVATILWSALAAAQARAGALPVPDIGQAGS